MQNRATEAFGLGTANATLDLAGSIAFLCKMVPITISTILNYRLPVPDSEKKTFSFKNTNYHLFQKNSKVEMIKDVQCLLNETVEAIRNQYVSTTCDFWLELNSKYIFSWNVYASFC